MADTLGMRTVASQVDSTGKLRAVTQLGVDYAQGYRVRQPEHIEDFEFRRLRHPAARRRRLRLSDARQRGATSARAAHARLVVAHQIGREFREHAHLGEVLRRARIDHADIGGPSQEYSRSSSTRRPSAR